MDQPVSLDRRSAPREALYLSRRRFPRLSVKVEAFYESDACALAQSRVELSLRGAFLRCHRGDAEGVEGVLRLDLGEGPMLRARVRVVRAGMGLGHGMALRFVELSESERLRLGAFLVRSGGLATIPALENRFAGWAQMPHAGLRRELRHGRRTR